MQDFASFVSRYNVATPTVTVDNELRELRIDSGGRAYVRLADDRDEAIRYFEDGESIGAGDRGIVMLGRDDNTDQYRMFRLDESGCLCVTLGSGGEDYHSHSDADDGAFGLTDTNGEVAIDAVGDWKLIHAKPVVDGRVKISGWNWFADKNMLLQVCMLDDSPITGAAEDTDITITAVDAGDHDILGPGEHFLINSPIGPKKFYVWYNVTDGANTQTDPNVTGREGIKVDLLAADTTNVIATKTAEAINAVELNFTSTAALAVVNVVNTTNGSVSDASDVDSGVTVVVNTQGVNETLDRTAVTEIIASAISTSQNPSDYYDIPDVIRDGGEGIYLTYWAKQLQTGSTGVAGGAISSSKLKFS